MGGQAELDPKQWVTRHADAMFRYALLQVRDREAAEERVQETFVAALEAQHSFGGASSERTWLIGILPHEAVEAVAGMFNKHGKWRDAPKRWAGEPDELLQRGEFWQALRQCLTRLPAPLGDAFQLREIQGLTTEKVRDLLGLSATNLTTRLSRARALLRRCLELAWFGKRPSRKKDR